VYPHAIAIKPWTPEQLQQDIALQHLKRTDSSSSHYILLNGAERPHYHDKHDLSVTIIKGESTLHFEDRTVILVAGDTAFIPKGTYHWAENSSDEGCEIHAVFSPAFDGKDKRLVN
jgi:mannose-6-phosphate isomerase-like protein (cupin superfamily)